MSNTTTGKWKIPTSVSITVFVIGVAAIIAAAVFFLRGGLKGNLSTVEANDAPFAARVDRLDGDIGIARQTGSQDQPYQGWTKATINAPVSLSDRIYVGDGSKAAIAFNSRNYARLNPRTSLDVLSLTPRHTQLALREGGCVFDVGALASDEIFEIGTPNGAVSFTEPGLYQVGIDDAGDTVVSVLSGAAHVADLEGTCDVSKGQLVTLAAAEAAEAIVSELSPSVAGTIVDDYYSYRYPTTYDGRYADYHAYEADPYYYDQTYRRSVSYQYIPDDTEIAGLEDLDSYGDWEDVPSYGHCWRPRNTTADWAPYRDGYWSNGVTSGLTWVSNERWGWAPYHYGRWAHVNQRWYWVPAEAVRQPVYAPALVAFLTLPRADEIGWVPLGPGDPYVPRYYDRDYQPRYVGSRTYVEKYTSVTEVVNYRDPAAITVVSVTEFTRVITPATVRRVDPAYLSSTRLVVDPFAVPVVRQLAPTIEASMPAVAVPVEVHQVLERPIVLRQRTVNPPVGVNVAETLKVQPIPEERAKRKLQIKSSGAPAVATQPNGLPTVPPEAKVAQLNDQERQARIAELAARAAEGNKAAKRELRQLEEQQRQQAAQQAAAQQQQEIEQRKAEKQASRAQAQQAEQQRLAQEAQQAEQRKAQKQAARQQTQQEIEQRKAEKQAARAQSQQAEQQRQAQAAQEAQQRKAQKQAARQQAEQAQQGEQRKAQKQAARQQAEQAQQAEQKRQAQLAQEAEQRRAQKQAARQQAQQAEQQRQAQAAQQAEQRQAEKRAAQQQSQQAEQQRQAQAAQQVEQRKAEKRAAQQQQAQQAEQQRQAETAQQAEQRKAQKRAAQEQAQQEAARQQAQQEQRRVQKQAQQQAQQQEQQAQQQRQQQKSEKRSQRQNAEQQPSQPEANPAKAERKGEKAKNKNKNSNP